MSFLKEVSPIKKNERMDEFTLKVESASKKVRGKVELPLKRVNEIKE